MTDKTTIRVSVKGQAVEVPAFVVDGITVIVTGKLLRVATFFDEDWLELEGFQDPAAFVQKMKATGVPADIFSFAQKLSDAARQYPYPHVPFNLAVAATSDYTEWWERRLPQETRKHVRKSQKLNLVVREVELNLELAQGLKKIYDETPIRQGRHFWHYGKSLEAVLQENSSYLDRSILIGAFLDTELVGFLKLVRIGNGAQLMQLICMAAQTDKKPNNALLAKAVELCAARGITQFVYGQYIYGRSADSTLTEFKRRNGFERIDLQRYFVPLTARGQMSIQLGLHQGWRHFLPGWLEQRLLALRTAVNKRRSATRR
jgi:hypothetical protein